jgi:hypothetical protein
MTRLLYWNVNNFSSLSLYPPMQGKRPRKGNDDPDYGEPAEVNDAADRRNILLNVVAAVQPALISIVEVKPGPVGALGIAEGQVIPDRGSYDLLWDMRRRTGIAYRLVPPVVSGTGRRAEGIAVYYDEAQLQFLGPWGWGNAGADDVATILPANLAFYPVPYHSRRRSALPNRPIPNGWPNAGLDERKLAGKWQWGIDFPSPGRRKPWMTDFRDIPGNRGIRLFSFHAPPQQLPPVPAVVPGLLGLAVGGTAQLVQLPEVTGGPLNANEVRCIVGDFNVSAFDAASDANSYALIRAAGFTQHLNPVGDGVANTWPGKAYYATHIRGSAAAEPFVSVGNNQDVRGYPGFDYSDRQTNLGWYDVIDNIFTRYGAGAATHTTVINPIARSPYTRDPAPPANVQQGFMVVGSQMNVPGVFRYNPALGQNGIWDQGPGANGARRTFQEWDNYTKVRSLSDHLPVAIDL